MSSPSRSGTTHLTVETVLQGEGWQKGWQQMLMIAGNCAAITERSFGVPDGVNNGQYGIGLVIDFFGLAGKASKFPVEFVYPSVTAIVPANIGMVANAKNADNARKFINYRCRLKARNCYSIRDQPPAGACRASTKKRRRDFQTRLPAASSPK